MKRNTCYIVLKLAAIHLHDFCFLKLAHALNACEQIIAWTHSSFVRGHIFEVYRYANTLYKGRTFPD